LTGCRSNSDIHASNVRKPTGPHGYFSRSISSALNPIVGDPEIGKLYVRRGFVSEGASLPCHPSGNDPPSAAG
jgi:hypothetical protein